LGPLRTAPVKKELMRSRDSGTTGRVPFSRFHTRLLSLLLLGIVVWWWPSAWQLLVPALSPYIAICSAIALRSVSLVSLLAVPMLLLVIIRRRFWCRHLCPVGLMSEYCGKARLGRPARSGEAHYETTPGAGQKSNEGRREHFRRLKRTALSWAVSPGRFFALATLGGAVVGYPLFLWMDPLAIFSGFFNVLNVSHSGVILLSMAALPIVMLISFLFPGTWCPRICPLGASQELLALAGSVLRRSKKKGAPAAGKTGHAGRRLFLALGTGTVCAALIPSGRSAERRPLRPPGNVDEKVFKGDCIRCGSCVRACPTEVIEPAADAGDPAGFLAPGLRFSGPGYCLQDCNLCGQVCPTGVIRPLPLDEKNRHIIGIAEIDLSECLLTLDRECGVCVPRCPGGAIEEEFSYETYTTTLTVIADKCNGCGACVGICPAKVVKVKAVS
jgi:NAD-dependent dihydropyrimidine dehydrogenase PreA subunit